jgi:hypothetical protein
MLAEEAAKPGQELDDHRANYEYGTSFVANCRKIVSAKRPDLEWEGEQELLNLRRVGERTEAKRGVHNVSHEVLALVLHHQVDLWRWMSVHEDRKRGNDLSKGKNRW